MSRFSSDLPLEVTSGLQRLVSIVDEQRPSGTPAALQALNFDLSSISGIDLLRGALGVGGDSEVETLPRGDRAAIVLLEVVRDDVDEA